MCVMQEMHVKNGLFLIEIQNKITEDVCKADACKIRWENGGIKQDLRHFVTERENFIFLDNSVYVFAI